MQSSDWNRFLGSMVKHSRPIMREPEGSLAHPYLDPGGPYSKSLWDWDSYWMAVALLGLAQKEKDPQVRQSQTTLVLRHAIGALDNFFDHQGPDGSLPILLAPHDTDYFDSVSNPQNNMAKPVFGQFISLLSTAGVEREKIKRWLSGVARFYECYRQRYRHGSGLYLWANDIAIGVDDDPTTWGRPPFSSASIFLNNFMLADLRAAAAVAKEMGRDDLAGSLNAESDSLQQAIQRLCWDNRDGFFYTADVLCKQQLVPHRHFADMLQKNLTPFWEALPLKVMTWSGFLPLWNQTATKDQAHRLVTEHLLNERRFWSPSGIRSLSADERMYSPRIMRGNPSNWLGPIWVIVNYLIWQGLLNYGYKKEAGDVAKRIIHLLMNDFSRNNHLHEYYDPESGEGVCGPGFWSWNLLAGLLPDDSGITTS